MNQDLYSFIENHSIIEIKEMLNSTIENCTLNDLNQNKITQKNINTITERNCRKFTKLSKVKKYQNSKHK